MIAALGYLPLLTRASLELAPLDIRRQNANRLSVVELLAISVRRATRKMMQ